MLQSCAVSLLEAITFLVADLFSKAVHLISLLVGETDEKTEEKGTYVLIASCLLKLWLCKRDLRFFIASGSTAYEHGTLCDKYHHDDDGWRHCDECDRQVHCGCIMGQNTYEINDTCGVTCMDCLIGSPVVSSVGDTSFLDAGSSSDFKVLTGIELLADPASGNASSNPTIVGASASVDPAPATRGATSDPITKGTTSDPTIEDAIADPATGGTSDYPAAGGATADPSTGGASANPSTANACADPAIRNACADPSIGSTRSDSTSGKSAYYRDSTWLWF
ncbi:uncharacterized protein [Spinacia oleracea]|uniref:Uncharacterized protein isoform X2 n=1 Tax=Spinacia oleracea TaxID=3562 RepID=A0ABM3QG34_SPIOL|nr:uncharacterized protein LOC110793053 isoform X2 [Spinacia oleracea]